MIPVNLPIDIDPLTLQTLEMTSTAPTAVAVGNSVIQGIGTPKTLSVQELHLGIYASVNRLDGSYPQQGEQSDRLPLTIMPMYLVVFVEFGLAGRLFLFASHMNNQKAIDVINVVKILLGIRDNTSIEIRKDIQKEADALTRKRGYKIRFFPVESVDRKSWRQCSKIVICVDRLILLLIRYTFIYIYIKVFYKIKPFYLFYLRK